MKSSSKASAVGIFAACIFAALVTFLTSDVEAESTARRLSSQIIAADSVTCPNNVADAGVVPALCTLTPSRQFGLVLYTCADADGCTVTMGEVGMLAGYEVRIINVGTNAVNIDEAANVTSLNADPVALGAKDGVILDYIGTEWVQVTATSNN